MGIEKKNIELLYQFWDGIHKSSKIILPMGSTTFEFTQKCLKELSVEYHHLEGLPAEAFMLVKEDSIVPAMPNDNLKFIDLYKSEIQSVFKFEMNEDVVDVSGLKLKIVER